MPFPYKHLLLVNIKAYLVWLRLRVAGGHAVTTLSHAAMRDSGCGRRYTFDFLSVFALFSGKIPALRIAALWTLNFRLGCYSVFAAFVVFIREPI
jgi:hypothetical protein